MPDTDDVTKFSTPAPVLLQIETAGGQVRVDAHDADHTVVRLRPSRAGDDRALDLIANSTVEQRGDRVLVEVPPAGVGFLRSSPDIDITVSLPTGSRLELAAKSADLRTSGLLDAVHVQIGSGDVWLDHVGEAHVQSGSGDTMLAVADRSVRVETGSGDVHLQHVTGALQVSTGSGDVLVDDACADVTIHTASGDHRVGRVRRGTVAMDSASGDVQVTVVEGTPVWLDVTSLSGSVHSALAGSEPPGDGEDAVALHINTVSGDISLAHA